MRFGIAKETITPYFKVNMGGFAGYFGEDFKTIHDDIYTHALVLEDDNGRKALIIALDVLFHDFSLTEEVMRFAENECGIPADHVLLNYSHTHNGPALKNYTLYGSSPEYDQYMVDAIKRSVQRACINTFEGEVSYASVTGDWNICRRSIIDGEVVGIPNQAGGRDKELKVFRFTDKEGITRTTLLSFACHPSSTGVCYAISSEYPGRLCQLIDAMLYGNTSLFLQGFGGDTKSRYAVTEDGASFKAAAFSEVDQMATGMFEEVKRAFLNNAFKPLKLDLAGKHFTVPLKLEVFPKSYYEEQYKTKWEVLVKSAQYVLDNYENLKETLDLHCSIMRLTDDMYIFAMGGEPSDDMRVILQDAFPDKKIIFVGYADDIAYVPTDKMIAEGGYEADGSVTEYRLKGRIAPGVNEAIIKAFKDRTDLM